MQEPAFLKTQCSQCGGRVDFPTERINTEAQCPHCTSPLRLTPGTCLIAAGEIFRVKEPHTKQWWRGVYLRHRLISLWLAAAGAAIVAASAGDPTAHAHGSSYSDTMSPEEYDRNVEEAARERAGSPIWRIVGYCLMVPVIGLLPLYLLQYDPKLVAQHREHKAWLKETSKEAERQREERIRSDPNTCPNCRSTNFNIHYPSRPTLWAPISLGGIFLSAASSAMADAMFRPEKVCAECGERWPAPEYE